MNIVASEELLHIFGRERGLMMGSFGGLKVSLCIRRRINLNQGARPWIGAHGLVPRPFFCYGVFNRSDRNVKLWETHQDVM